MSKDFAKPDKITLQEIPDGVPGTKATVNKIIEEAKKGAINWDIITLARNITYPTKPRDNKAMSDLLFYWVKNNIKFVRDPVPAEMVQSPQITVQCHHGDCDDMVCLLSALNLSVGIPVRYVCIAAIDGNDNYSHIYMEAQNQDDWVSYDASFPDSYPGWYPPRHHKKGLWTVDGEYSELGSFLSKTWKKIRAELKRFEQRVRAERDRFNDKLSAEFTRMEKNFGPFGKFLVLGTKVLITAGLTIFTLGIGTPLVAGMGTAGFALSTGGGLVLASQPLTVMTIQSFETPWKLTPEEWKMLAQLAATFSSAVLSIVSGGAAMPLLISSVISIANTSVSAVDMMKQIEDRKEVIRQLKEAKIQIEFEERVRREAINKMVADIEALEYYLTKQKEAELEIRKYKQELEKMLEQEKLAGKEGFISEVDRYKKEMKSDTERYMVDFENKNKYVYADEADLPDSLRQQLPTMRSIEQQRQRTDAATAAMIAEEREDIPAEVDTFRNSNTPWRSFTNKTRFMLYR